MSWLKNLFHAPEPPSREEVAKRQKSEILDHNLNSIKRQFDERFHQEAALLTALGIPVPQIVSDLHYEYQSGKDWPKLILPRIGIPAYIAYITVIPKDPTKYSPHPGIRYYCFFADQATVSKACSILDTEGAARFLEDFPNGIWLNRDPYQFYQLINSNPDGRIGHTGYHLGDSSSRESDFSVLANLRVLTEQSAEINYTDPTPLKPKFLTKVEGFTPQDLRMIQKRVKYFNRWITAYNREPADYLTPTVNETIPWERVSRPSNLMPHASFFSMTVPEPAFCESLETVKIIPAAPVKTSIAIDFIKSLHYVTHPLAFEFIDKEPSAYFQLSFSGRDRQLIERQLQLYLSGCSIVEQPNCLTDQTMSYIRALPAELYDESRKLSEFTLDPLCQLFSMISTLDAERTTILQVLLNPFASELLEEVKQYEFYGLAKRLPLWQVTVNLFCSSEPLLKDLKTAFLEQFQAGAKEDWQQNKWTFEFGSTGISLHDMERWTLMSSAEVASLAHLPVTTIQFDRLEMSSMKSKLPPPLYTDSGNPIGVCEVRGQQVNVTLPESVRDKHVYIIGKSGSGKSTLLLNMIVQNIEQGHGLCVIDPHGDLVDTIADYIPSERVADTIYFDPTDAKLAIPLNILNVESDDNLNVLVDDLVVTFRRLSENWGEQMDSVLRATIGILLRSKNPTFFDIQKLLRNERYRKDVVEQIDYPPLQEFWEFDYPKLKNAAAPILHRMMKFSESTALYGMLSQPQSKLNFSRVMQERKILLCNLSSGELGEDNSKLLGSLIVSQIQLAAMRRAKLPASERVPFYLYIDEFQNFPSSAFERILSEARKYALNLTLAHQYLGQLDERTTQAILGNVGTIIVLPIDQKDARYLQHSLGDYQLEDILNLDPGEHEALCRPITKARDTFNLTMLPPPAQPEDRNKEEIIAHTIATYGAAKYSAASPDPESEQSDLSRSNPSNIPILLRMPVEAPVQSFGSIQEKMLFFLNQAKYLSGEQIRRLCYGHLKASSQRTALIKHISGMLSDKKVKEAKFDLSTIYYVGRALPITSHDLAVRDVYTKIILSGYAIADVSFFLNTNQGYKNLNPDLSVTFFAQDGGLVSTLWEIDMNTEGMKELQSKVRRYELVKDSDRVAFLFNDQIRMERSKQILGTSYIRYAMMSGFESLRDRAFFKADNSEPETFFRAEASEAMDAKASY